MNYFDFHIKIYLILKPRHESHNENCIDVRKFPGFILWINFTDSRYFRKIKLQFGYDP